jgi:DNA-binding NarL/FixJ family response regulator
VLCVPAHGTADQLTALMAAHVLRSASVDAAALPHAGGSAEALSYVAENEPDIVVIASLPPLALVHARDCCQRLRSRLPRLQIVVGTWKSDGVATPATVARLSAAGADHIVGSFEALTATVLAMLPERSPRVRELLPSGHDLPDASLRFPRERAGNS